MSRFKHYIHITENREFIDSIYNYSKLKEYSENSEEKTLDEKNKSDHNSCLFYICAIQLCLNKIFIEKNELIKSEYLDWIRWNHIIIDMELNRYLEIFHNNDDIVERITKLMNDIKLIMSRYFQLSETEKSICNEYVHSYDIILRRNSPVLIQQSGRLYKNYIKILTDKYLIENLDRDIAHVKLYEEGEILISKLYGINDQLADDIVKITKNFKEFIESDCDLRKAQDLAIANALDKAHARANETRLESIKREIIETINNVKKALERKLEEAIDLATVLIDPILHPIETIKNLYFCIRHPVVSFNAIKNWVYEHPWKAGFLLVGGISVAFLTGIASGCLFGGALETILGATIADEVLIGTFLVTSSLRLAQSAGNIAAKVSKFSDEAKKEIMKIEYGGKEKEDEENEKIKNESNRIASEIRNAERIRKRMKAAKECEEANIRMEEEVKQTAYNNQKKQLAQLNSNVLEAALPQLNATLEDINQSQNSNCIKNQELENKSTKVEEIYGKIRDGNNARRDLINLLSGN